MPQYADPGFLLNAQQINPMAAETSAITLHDLMTKSETGDLDLEQKRQMIKLMSDPIYQMLAAQMLSQGLGGAGGAGGLPGGAGGGIDAATIAKVFGAYPQAAGGAFTSLQGLAEKQAQIDENRAKAGNYVSETKGRSLDQAANIAASVLALADKETGVVPEEAYKAAVRAIAGTGTLRNFSDPPPPGSPQISDWLKTVMTPKIAGEQATTKKTATEESTIIPKFLLDQQREFGGKIIFQDGSYYLEQPYRDASGRMTTRLVAPGTPGMKATSPTAGVTLGAPTNAATIPGTTIGTASGGARITPEVQRASDFVRRGTLMQELAKEQALPNPNPQNIASIQSEFGDIQKRIGGPAPASPATAPPAQGVGLKVSPSAFETKQYEGAVKQVDELVKEAAPSAEIKQILTDMNRDMEAGIYAGGVKGTDFYRKLVRLGVATGMISQEGAKTLANTEDWNAQGIKLLAQAVRQFASGRVAAQELDYLAPSKINAEMSPMGIRQLATTMYKAADRAEQHADQAGKYLNQPNTYSLSGFRPQFKDVAPPWEKPALAPYNAKGWKLMRDARGNQAYVSLDGKQYEEAK